MTKSQKFKFVCWSILRVAVFYAVMLWWSFQFSPLFYELYMYTPFVLFAPVVFFLALFLCRTMGCLVFMPKDKLKAILRDGQIAPTASQIVLRLFSWPFLKRITQTLILFVAEFYLRLLSINIFLTTVNATLKFWEKVSSMSDFLLSFCIILTAYAIMELPFYLLFYKLSFKGHANRTYEYRFGIKISAFILILLFLQFLLLPLSVSQPDFGNALSIVILTALGIAIWYLMYRKNWSFCCKACPACSTLKNLFGKTCCCRQEKEQAELQDSYQQAEKLAESIIEAEARDITPQEETKENKE